MRRAIAVPLIGGLLVAAAMAAAAQPLADLQRAARSGDPQAQFVLAEAYRTGEGVGQSRDQAIAWYRRAAAAGLPQAKASLAKMEPYLQPADKAQGEQMLATMTATSAAPPVAAAPPAVTQPAPLPPPRAAPAPIARVAVPPSRPAAPPPAPPRAIARPATAGGEWRIQLGAFSTRARAEAAWKQLAGRLRRLGDHPHQLTAVGPVWRLQASGFASREGADAQCRAVIAGGGGCLTLEPERN